MVDHAHVVEGDVGLCRGYAILKQPIAHAFVGHRAHRVVHHEQKVAQRAGVVEHKRIERRKPTDGTRDVYGGVELLATMGLHVDEDAPLASGLLARKGQCRKQDLKRRYATEVHGVVEHHLRIHLVELKRYGAVFRKLPVLLGNGERRVEGALGHLLPIGNLGRELLGTPVCLQSVCPVAVRRRLPWQGHRMPFLKLPGRGLKVLDYDVPRHHVHQEVVYGHHEVATVVRLEVAHLHKRPLRQIDGGLQLR